MGCDDEEKKKNENNNQILKISLAIVCEQRQLDQQATAQTALKLRVVYNTNTKVLCL